jgi:RNA polymerase sigma factor (sigma-70 family)
MVAATLADQSDGQLVERFLAGQDEAVFDAIVRRHGAMVYRVCWRVLQHHQDAEDALQATFLVLAQRLRTVRKHASLASWLHGAAHRVALKSKAHAATRRRHEEQALGCTTAPADDVSWGEVRTVLDAELAGLPEKWRLPLVLCYLEGRTQDEAAKELGWSKRTLRRRLEEGRTSLGRRLSRRGVVWPAALSAVLLSDAVASATLSPGLLDSTIKGASLFAAGQTAAAGLISVKAVALTEGVLKTMLLSKIKVAIAMVLVVVAAGVGGNRLLVPTGAAEGADKPTQVQSDKPQSPPQKDEPRILILEKSDGVWRQHCLFVRDPSSGEWKPLTRQDGIPVLKGHIEVGVKKLKEAKDDKSIREALRGLEESVRNMKDLLSLPGAPAEKKPEDKKPEKEKPALKPGPATPADDGAKPHNLPALPDLRLRLEKLADRLGLAGNLAKINAVNARELREVLIRIVKDVIEDAVISLKDAKDEKSMREALKGLEESVQNIKELLSLPGELEQKPTEEKTPLKKGAAFDLDEDAAPRRLAVAFADLDDGNPPDRRTETKQSEKEKGSGKVILKLGDSEILVDWYLWQDKPPLKDLGGFEEFKTLTREEAIPIFKNYIALAAKKVKEAKDEKSMREALEGLERSVQMLKELLSFGTPAEKKHDLSETLKKLNSEKSAPKK